MAAELFFYAFEGVEGEIFSELGGGGKDYVLFVDFSVLQGSIIVVLGILLSSHVLYRSFTALVVRTPLPRRPKLALRDVGHCSSESLLDLRWAAVLKQRFWHVLIEKIDLLYRIVF